MARKTECIAMLLAGGQGSSSAADSGSSQKRTTSDFTHNDYSLIFRSRGHRMPRKHAFQCPAERPLLYTREV